MSTRRRHDKSPSKQYRPVHAPVAGYPGHNDAAEFNQTGRIDNPGMPGAQPPQINSQTSPMSPLPEDLGPTRSPEANR